ncbi:hypothetical protein PCANB_000780 [Pneumocystis canis]|nr:hypothetical protein PCANB_000780 [Pneumocystis canis]
MISENDQNTYQHKMNTFNMNLLNQNFSEKFCNIFEEEKKIQKNINKINNRPLKRVCSVNDDVRICDSEKSEEIVNIQEIPFPNGTVKITAVKGYEKREHDITIEDVFQPKILKAAVLSAFVIDPLWVLSKIQLSNTIVVFVHQAKLKKERQAINELYLCFPNVSAIFPSMEGANCMHCKLQLLFYTTYLRVVIPSANLVDYDWGETGVMENSMYIHDFPRRTSVFTGFSTNFEKELFYYCKAKNYPEYILQKIQCYDFTMSKNLHFIHSIPSKAFNNDDLEDTGCLSLARAVYQLGKVDKDHTEIDIMTSSLGLLKPEFLSNMYRALEGDQTIISCNTNVQTWKTSMKIHFPSVHTVLSSNGGKESAGTICFQKRFWQHIEFPKSILYDSTSVHKGCLMHHKIIFVRNRISNFGFFYLGSANFSASAWGILELSKEKKPIFSCRNWECGIVLPLNDYHSSIIKAFFCETIHILRKMFLKRFSVEKSVLKTQKISQTPRLSRIYRPFLLKIQYIHPTYISSKNYKNIKTILKSTIYENIYTIPNLFTFSRLLLAPVTGYFVLHEQYLYAILFFIYASLSDMLDGWISRKWNLGSISGTIFDPIADKFFVIILTLCLSIQQQIPYYLSSVIFGKDILLGLSAIYYRWISLDSPRTFKRYFDFSMPTIEVRPTLISKVNTALQHVLIGTTMIHLFTHSEAISIFLNLFHYLVFTTTIWSGLSYIYTKDAVRILNFRPSTASGRLTELLEAIRNEFDSIAQEAIAFRNHKDDYEHKVTSQIQEMQTIRQTVYELEMAHQKMKQSYDEEISRLRRELDSRGIHLSTTSQSALPRLSNPPNLPFPPPNLGLNNLPTGRTSNHGDSKTCLSPSDTSQTALQLPYPNAGYPSMNNVHSLQSCPQHSNKRIRADGTIDNNAYGVQKGSNYSSVSGETTSNAFIPVQPPSSRTVAPPATLATVPPSTSSVSHGQSGMSMADIDPDMIPRELKKEGSDWTVLFNPNVPRVLDINLIHTLEHQSVVCCIRFSHDGEYLATGCNRVALIFDVKTGKRLTVLQDESVDREGDLYIRSVAFSPDGKYLATGAEDKRIRIWDIAKKKIRHLFTGHEQDIYSLDYSQNGKFIASGSGDRTTRVWDIETGRCILTLSIEDGVTTVAISPDSRYVAAGSLDKVVRVWDSKTGYLVERFEDHKDSVYSVAFTPNGCGLLSGSLDKTVKLWELTDIETSSGPRNGLCKATLTGHKDFVLSVACSPDGHWVLSGSKDRGVQFWDYHGCVQLILQGHKNSVISVAVSPIGRLFATGSGDCRARIWEYVTMS